MTQIPRTARTKLHRASTRKSYDREAVYAAIDAAVVGHVDYAIDDTPYVTPTAMWREGDHVYWHAADSGRMAKHLAGGTTVCVTVTPFDGLVLARRVHKSVAAGMTVAKVVGTRPLPWRVAGHLMTD